MDTVALRIGVAGLGRAFTLMLPTFTQDMRVKLVAAADPLPQARAQFERDFGAPTYASIEALCADPQVQVLYVATPHQFHAEHVLAAARHGGHAPTDLVGRTMMECYPGIEATPIFEVMTANN